MSEKYNEIYFDDHDHKAWLHLFNQQLTYIRDKVDLDFLQNLELLKPSSNYIPNLSQISNTLKAITGWHVVGVKGLVELLKFFELLSQRQFSPTIYMRDSNTLGIAYVSDIFHGLFGHVPTLDERHRHYIQKS